MKAIRALYERYKESIRYVFFGGLTTLVNMAAYRALYQGLGVSNLASTAVAWLVSVLFAFVTNKLWVFRSPDWKSSTVLREGGGFFACRVLTGALDMLIMYISVDLLKWNSDLMKLLSNCVVILLNFVASKRMIFKK